MRGYVVKDIDVFTKTANIYIDGELVIEFGYHPDDPYRNVFDQMVNGSTPMHLTTQPFPSIGMQFNGTNFIDGFNGETFIQYDPNEIPNCYLDIPAFGLEAIVTLNSENIVDGVLIILGSLWGDVKTDTEMLIAALMSSPSIQITNGADPFPDFEIAGTVIQIQELSDLEHLKPVDWQG